MSSRRTRSRGGNERGAVVVMQALCMTGLVTMAAFAIDLGHQRTVKRDVQNSVDSASLAAVAEFHRTSDNPLTVHNEAIVAAIARAEEYLDDNGFDPNVEDVTITTSVNADGEDCVAVTLKDFELKTVLAPVIDVDELFVTAASEACLAPGPPSPNLPAAFAGGDTCSAGEGKTYVSSGNHNRFEGDIHSNFDVKDSGEQSVRTGAATYVDKIIENKGLWNGATKVPAQPWPLRIDINEYRPNGERALAAGNFYTSYTNDRFFSNNIQAGVYYTTKKFTFGNNVRIVPRTINGVTRTGATFISEGLMEVSGNNSIFTPFQTDPYRLTFYAGWWDTSKARCDNEVFKLSGNCVRFDGTIYVPDGVFTFSGEGNGHDYNGGSQCNWMANTPHYSGGILTWGFKFSGNRNILRSGGVPFLAGDPIPHLES